MSIDSIGPLPNKNILTIIDTFSSCVELVLVKVEVKLWLKLYYPYSYEENGNVESDYLRDVISDARDEADWSMYVPQVHGIMNFKHTPRPDWR